MASSSSLKHANQVRICGDCNIYVTGIIPWQQHIQGQQHQKKCHLIILKKSNQVRRSTCYTHPPSDCFSQFTAPPTSHSSTLADRTGSRLCLLCLRTGHTTVQSSRTGTQSCYTGSPDSHAAPPYSHSSPLPKHTTLPTSSTVTPYSHSSPLPKHTTLPTSSTVTPSSLALFYCKLCNIQCNGPVPFENHLSCSRHLRRQYLQTLKNEDETTYLTPANLSNFSNPVGISVKNAGVPVKKTKPPKKDDLLLNRSLEDYEVCVIGADEPVDL